mmetsp:Transcript_14111/g.37727  ORF Transcript_14111/g.37727 Transcript_14111/m.37727 type:complete len:174 (-) Transcript_14111:94-615(-)
MRQGQPPALLPLIIHRPVESNSQSKFSSSPMKSPSDATPRSCKTSLFNNFGHTSTTLPNSLPCRLEDETGRELAYPDAEIPTSRLNGEMFGSETSSAGDLGARRFIKPNLSKKGCIWEFEAAAKKNRFEEISPKKISLQPPSAQKEEYKRVATPIPPRKEYHKTQSLNGLFDS